MRLTEASLRTCSLWEKNAASFRTAGSSETTVGDVASSRGEECQLPVTSPVQHTLQVKYESCPSQIIIKETLLVQVNLFWQACMWTCVQENIFSLASCVISAFKPNIAGTIHSMKNNFCPLFYYYERNEQIMMETMISCQLDSKATQQTKNAHKRVQIEKHVQY